MNKLGCVLPTRKSLAINDSYAKNLAENQRKVAEAELSEFPSRYIHGETRYYKTPTIWAIVGRDLTVKWFETRTDGDYRI
jgi:hypothetical protein